MSVALLPNSDLTPLEHRRLTRRHRTCLLAGHVWVASGYDPATGRVPMHCSRCFPSVDSIRVGYLTSLMPEVDTET